MHYIAVAAISHTNVAYSSKDAFIMVGGHHVAFSIFSTDSTADPKHNLILTDLQSLVDGWIDFARFLEAPLASWLQPGSAQSQHYTQVNSIWKLSHVVPMTVTSYIHAHDASLCYVQASAKAKVTADLNVLEQHLTTATFLVRLVLHITC